MKHTAPISTAHIKPVFDALHEMIEQAEPPGDSLLTGRLGLALYYFTLYEILEDPKYADQCIAHLEQVLNSEDEGPLALTGHSFANGAAGLGSLLALCTKAGIAEINIKEDFAEPDQNIFRAAMQQIAEGGSLDYLHGAMGALHYFSLRSDEPLIKSYLETLAEAICNQAVYTEHGCWFRNFIIDVKEKQYINTSLSHGNSGFLLILLKLIQAGICVEKLKAVIRDGIRLLFHLRIKPDPGKQQYAFFPFQVNEFDPSAYNVNNRLAWCYGDLNIILLLYKAAEQLNEPAWKREADEMASFVLGRMDESSTLITDSHFCHGAAGLAHLYSQLFFITRQKRFNEAAASWTGQTIDYLGTELKGDRYKGLEGDMLNGLPGIGLVLLSHLSGKQTSWSRLLLL